MSSISFHGTNKQSALKMIGPPPAIDVNIGKGELGKGFYTGLSIAMAAIWAQSRYGDEGVVIEFDIPKPKFVQLKGHLIKNRAEVIKIWTGLKANKGTTTFSFGHDYVISPFATIEENGYQLKFESQRAEDELNESHKSVYPCGS